MATIRIDLSDETLAAIERERAARGETQSEFVARALKGFLERQSNADAHKRNPESKDDEIEAVVSAQVHAFPKSYWDDDYAQDSKQIDVSDETDEIALSVALARYAFEANPWDGGGDSAASTANR